MIFSLSRWRPRHILLAWSVYWLGLILVTLRPAIGALWRISRTGAHGSANAGISDGVFSASILQSGQATWTGSISLSTVALLLALPPLALWVIWLIASSRTNNAGGMRSMNHAQHAELEASDKRPRTPGMTESFSQTSNRQRREES